jgi:hypothetical protein
LEAIPHSGVLYRLASDIPGDDLEEVFLEWIHAEFGGQGQSLVIKRFRLGRVRWIAMHGDLVEELQSIGLITQ